MAVSTNPSDIHIPKTASSVAYALFTVTLKVYILVDSFACNEINLPTAWYVQ